MMGLDFLAKRFRAFRVQSRKGFSLVDVLIAMVILAIAIGATAALSIQAARTLQEDVRITAASNLADYKLEELRNLAYGAVVDGADDAPIDNMGNSPGEFTRSWTVVNDSPATGLKTVTVAVSWTQTSGTESYQLTGVIGQ